PGLWATFGRYSSGTRENRRNSVCGSPSSYVSHEMDIGHLQKFSLIDYPGRICAVIFTAGCNFRCPWCHNPELVRGFPSQDLLPDSEIMDFLEKRQGKLEGVTITGGEPTLHDEQLATFAAALKGMGFPVKLDTNGSRPPVLEELIRDGLVDYIAMDVKGPLDSYTAVTGVPVDTDLIEKSIDLVMASGLDYEFRTTVVRQLLTPTDMERTAERLSGARCYIIQRFVPTKTLDPKFQKGEVYDEAELNTMLDRVRRHIPEAFLR
ncbi:MAG: anaerobic ribonucleoside-triphosphate reductase activating protein, partial [Syntrophales bacterium]|nr:anaerobic ribonucleoside-triphosphate reductase activating protein [Syntrophales bacterium]